MIRTLLTTTVLVLTLSACAGRQHPTQEISIQTVGTTGALCFLESEGYRQRVWAPKKVRIVKSGQPLVMNCMAPGNRKKVIVVEPVSYGFVTDGLNQVTDNVVNMKVGGTDSYPETIVVDFTDMKPTSMPLPEYQYVLDQNPDMVGLEEFRPGMSALQRDRGTKTPTLQPRSTTNLYSTESSSTAAPVIGK